MKYARPVYPVVSNSARAAKILRWLRCCLPREDTNSGLASMLFTVSLLALVDTVGKCRREREGVERARNGVIIGRTFPDAPAEIFPGIGAETLAGTRSAAFQKEAVVIFPEPPR